MEIEPQTPAPSSSRREGALGPYLRALASHPWLVLLVTLAAAGGSLAYLSQRTPQYEATAEILVTPLPADDQTFLGLQFLRDSGDPTRTVQTAAALIDSLEAARVAAERLGEKADPRELRESIEVKAQGESNILAVTATADGSQRAAAVANQYARAALDVRREALQREVAATIKRLSAREGELRQSDATAASELAQRLTSLEAVRSGNDPTLSLSESAAAPATAVGAPSWLVVSLAVFFGFVIGVAAALVVELLDRRVRDEEELTALYPVPVLARVPLIPRRLRHSRRRSALDMPPAVREAFRTLAVELQQRTRGRAAVTVTSASTGDGKTTSAIGLAMALIGGGHKVILIDFDVRKPDIGPVLGIQTERGLVSMLASSTRLEDLLVGAPDVPYLQVVPVGSQGDVVLLEALARRLPDILAEAEALADFVVVDTPPLGEVSDALRLTALTDETIVVARTGHTDRGHFELMRDLLERSGDRPSGVILIGDASGPSSTYYTYSGDGQGPPSGRRSLVRSPSR